ncbi:MAG: carbohydrate-binding family 9-like protein [FCB group bacterium]|nr:carbohydrate-binding family 9-like protein [FCB group bacterium]
MNGEYPIYYNKSILHNTLNWNDPVWGEAEVAEILYFHPRGSSHHPRTGIKIAYNQIGIFILFRVMDRYVRSVHTEYNAKVHEDSCVEWFFQPPGAEGYYNFEMNAGGTLHVNYIIDPERDEHGKRKNIRSIPEQIAQKIIIESTLPPVVDPEIRTGTEWRLAVHIPWSFFDHYTPIAKIGGAVARGNLYKCGDKTSHPHWGAWNPVDELNFHRPGCFGSFVFIE